ncbi:MAG: hypothetical protein J5I65_12230 [Aridibacter famidurans]|nr:hypothetical protein [Aridibacter famidurans]
MKPLLAYVLLMLCFCCIANAQDDITKVVRLEIDGQEVKESYKVSFLIDEKWREVQTTSTGFKVPKELKDQEYLSVLFEFGGHRLAFSRLHSSKFRTDWIVGVDLKPFSEDLVDPEEMEVTDQVYYIEFNSRLGLGTKLVVKISFDDGE